MTHGVLTPPDGWRHLPFFVQDLPRIAAHLAQTDAQVLPPAHQVFAALMTLVRETGLSCLIATHNLELAARMDRQLRLDAGGLHAG